MSKILKRCIDLLVKDNWELLMTGIFRASERFGTHENSFEDIFTLDIEYFVSFYNSSFPSRQEGENRLAKIERVLSLFYEEVLKDKFEQFINEREGFEYHSIESMVAIQKEAQGYKKRIIEFESSKLLGIYSSSWDDNFFRRA